MKIKKLIKLLKKVKLESGNRGIKIMITTKHGDCFIEKIEGISFNAFEGLNLTNDKR